MTAEPERPIPSRPAGMRDTDAAPPRSPEAGTGKRRALLAAACLVASLLVFISRKPDQWLAPQFWAEDGTEFFFDAEVLGWLSCLKPYAGYLHLAPRLIACSAAQAPWEQLPAIYVLAAGVLAAAVVVRFAFARVPVLVRVLGPVAVVAAPHSGEVFLNVTNLNWFLSLLLIMNLLEPAPARTTETSRRGAEVLLAGLSGPSVVCLAPFALWWAWRSRWRREACIVLACWVLATLVQSAVLLSESRAPNAGVREVIGSLSWVPGRYAMAVFVGQWLPYHAVLGHVIAAVAVVAIGTLFLDPTNGARCQAGWLMLAASVLLVAGRFAADTWGNPLGGGARYTYVPLVLFLLAVGWLAMGARRRGPRMLALALYLAPIWAASSMWVARRQPQFEWARQVREVRAGIRSRLEVPPSHSFAVPRRNPLSTRSATGQR